jgi:hypothetical protein
MTERLYVFLLADDLQHSYGVGQFYDTQQALKAERHGNLFYGPYGKISA